MGTGTRLLSGLGIIIRHYKVLVATRLYPRKQKVQINALTPTLTLATRKTPIEAHAFFQSELDNLVVVKSCILVGCV